jgi:hypothetical protein
MISSHDKLVTWSPHFHARDFQDSRDDSCELSPERIRCDAIGESTCIRKISYQDPNGMESPDAYASECFEFELEGECKQVYNSEL